MKLIVGLGNIGPEYRGTRHNAGFVTVDCLADRLNLSFKLEQKHKAFVAIYNNLGNKTIIIKPTTYMNLSGFAVRSVMQFYKIPVEDIIVINDDLDLPVGKIRLRGTGSAGGHNGLKSIIENTGTKNFKRVKVGIGRDKNIPVVDYVLGHFKKDDKPLLVEAVNSAADVLESFMDGEDFQKISSNYNQKKACK